MKLSSFHTSVSCAAVLGAIVFSTALAAVQSTESIKALIAESRVEEAITASREWIAEHPKDPEGHVLLANALLRKARSDAGALPDGRPAPLSKVDADAIAQELEAGIKVAPTRKDIYLGLIDLWSLAGRDEEVLRQVQRAAAQFPSDAKMMNGLLDIGFERQGRGDPLAGRILESVYTAYPRSPEAIVAWASHLLGAGDLEKSIQVLEGGAANAPPSVDVMESLGDAYTYKLDFESAAKAYARASAIDPNRRQVKMNWAAALHVVDPRSARVVAEPLRAEEKVGGAPTVELGKEGAKRPGRVSTAAGQLMRAVGNPSLSGLDAYLVAKSFWQSALAPAAIAETQVALIKDPLLVEGWMLRAEIFARAGLDKQALEALERADSSYDAASGRTFAFSRDEVIAARAGTLGRLQMHEEALKTYKRISSPSRYAYQMGILLEKMGKIEEARVQLEQVIAAGANAAEVEAAKTRLSQDPYRKKP